MCVCVCAGGSFPEVFDRIVAVADVAVFVDIMIIIIVVANRVYFSLPSLLPYAIFRCIFHRQI